MYTKILAVTNFMLLKSQYKPFGIQASYKMQDHRLGRGKTRFLVVCYRGALPPTKAVRRDIYHRHLGQILRVREDTRSLVDVFMAWLVINLNFTDP